MTPMAADRPFFTVVTPVYQGLAFLEGCVKSLLAQTFGSYEHLLIDDGSPDASGKLCDALALADGRIRVIHTFNGGVTSARNFGIREARGRWLLFLDQDDRLSPYALETIRAALPSAGCDLVSWKFHNVWAEMAPGPCGPHRRYARQQMGLFYRTDTMHYVWTKAFNTDFLHAQGLLFDESIQDGTDDLPFVNAYCRAWFTRHPGAGVWYLEQPLYYYETGNEASVSNRRQPFLESHLTMFTDLMQDMDRLYGAPEAEQAPLYRRCLHTLAYGILSTPKPRRKALRQTVLRRPEVAALLDRMKRHKVYSPFYLPYRLGSTSLVCFLFRSFEGSKWWYWKFYWLGYYLLGGDWQRD